MSEKIYRRGLAPNIEVMVGRHIEHLCKGVALFGGFALVTLAILTLLSIVGRQFLFIGLGPIPGDFELVEIGCALAMFSFLPWCLLRDGHARVDIFTSPLGPRAQSLLELIWNTIMVAVSALLVWRAFDGMIEKIEYSETTLILEIPLWYGYLSGVMGMGILVLVSVFTTWRSLNDLATGERSSL